VQQELETDELMDAAKRLLGGDRVGSRGEGGLWSQFSDLGWLGISIPEASGGLGQPFSALAILYRELGARLDREPFASTSVSLDGLARFGPDRYEVADLIERTLAGKAVLVPVSIHPVCIWSANDRLHGVIRNVMDAGAATHLLVPIARDAISLAVVELPHPGIEITHRPTWDHTRGIYDVRFNDVAIDADTILLSGGKVEQALDGMAAHFDLAIACDAIGGCGEIFRKTLDYMMTRQQFNRPIASFQALKHRAADWKTAIETSRALVDAACKAYSTGEGDWQTLAACSRLYAGSVYRGLTEDAIQLHGGIGFTWDHDCHWYLKRARLNDILGGSPEQRKDRLAPALFRDARAVHGSG
jgi:alkylation response protein AidB-like acyl-CoA dehydrogenase